MGNTHADRAMRARMRTCVGIVQSMDTGYRWIVARFLVGYFFSPPPDRVLQSAGTRRTGWCIRSMRIGQHSDEEIAPTNELGRYGFGRSTRLRHRVAGCWINDFNMLSFYFISIETKLKTRTRLNMIAHRSAAAAALHIPAVDATAHARPSRTPTKTTTTIPSRSSCCCAMHSLFGILITDWDNTN